MKNDLRPGRAARRGLPRVTPGILVVALASLLVLYLLGLWAYNKYFVSDEEKLRALVASAARAAQDRRAGGITATLSEDFVFHCGGEAGNLNRDICHQALVMHLANYRQVQVRLSPVPIPIEVRPDRQAAEFTFDAQVRGRNADEAPWENILPPNGGSKYTIRAKLTENGWKFSELWIEK